MKNVNSLLGLERESFGLPLPIGISFYTFQAISYVVDVYRKTVVVQKNLSSLGLYIAFFPQLIAGPIVRYQTIEKQIRNRTTTMEQFSKGIELFCIGVGKKMILANNFAVVSEYSFGRNAGELSVVMAWMGALYYSLQIYFDFSGYSDMAIGLAKMFGFDFNKNFHYPYMAHSITDFWRRWHISLSSWFRDYVYITLGGSRVDSKKKLIRNLFVVWILTGIWHGAAWKFLAWGMFYFLLLTFEKLTGYPDKFKSCSMKVVYRMISLFSIMIAWVVFGELGFKPAATHIMAMFGLYGNAFSDPMVIFHFVETRVLLVVALLICTPVCKEIDERLTERLNGVQGLIYGCFKVGCEVFLLAIAVSYLAIGAHNPFIYFNF